MAELIKNIQHSQVFVLKDAVQWEEGRINSLTLSQTPTCKMTLFAIDTDEGMSSHAASGDAMVTCLEGRGEIILEGVSKVLESGQSLVMSAGAPHSVKALEPFKMLLVVVKEA